MPIHNADVAAIFDEIADLLDIQGANPFRIRAYRNAARTVGEFGREMRALVEEGIDLAKLPGIGTDLSAKIHEILETGKCGQLEKLHLEVPAAIAELLRIPGLGPKRVKTLYHTLHIQNLDDLRDAAEKGRIQALTGFGEKIERQILDAVSSRIRKKPRMKLAQAAQYARPLQDYLAAVPGVERVDVAGSVRRMRETVGDLDLLAIAGSSEAIMSAFATYEEIKVLRSAGATRSSAVLKSGLQVDLRVVEKSSYGAALHYFTGSRAHNIAIRRMAQEKGLKVNEYGVFKGGRQIAGSDEASVYGAVGLAYIPPELREGRGEIEAAMNGTLPDLIRLEDLRGDLHAHTRRTDGRHSLAEMADAARRRGWDYLAITDRPRHLALAHGVDANGLARQIDEIDELNAQWEDFRLLKGIEVDILEDGTLDLPAEALGRLDLVVGAVHSHFDLSRAKQTARILRAMESPHFTILAHPNGRLIDEREPCELDMDKVIREAAERGCFLELNAHPDRLDLFDIQCQQAKTVGVLVAINSDAHATAEFDHLCFGIGQGRRGWLTPEDVLNTRALPALMPLLRGTL